MGVPMSKADQSGSEIEGGQLFEKCSEANDTKLRKLDSTRKSLIKGAPDVAVIPKTNKEVNQRVQMSCIAVDDIPDDSECHVVYHRLKPSKINDLHSANTRFTAKGPVKSTSGPLFTTTETQQSTRICSTDFSPHLVSFDFENSNSKLTNTSGVDPSEDMSTDRPSAPIPPLLSEDVAKEYVSPNNSVVFSKATNSLASKLEIESNTVDPDIEVPLHSKIARDKPKGMMSTLLTVPENARNFYSPVPVPGQTDEVDIDLEDPFEGMGIPRERVYSMGSSSLYSVKEISDRLYQEYFYEVRNSIRNYGFFEKFPTPSVVGDAQRTYRQMDIPTPADEEGNILPYPPKITKGEVFASQTKSFTDIDHRIINAPDKILNCGETAEIVNYLCLGLEDDLSKIRAISTWLAIRQMQESGNKKPVSPEDWCRKFRAMCRFSRIKTKLVKGIIRGPNYIPGEDLENQKGEWISVLVNNTWWLVDPVIHKENPGEQANSPIQNGKTNTGDISSLFCHAESFFWDPEEFIFTHYPDEEYWQMLARPITREEFFDLAVLSKGFFSLRLKLISPIKSVLVVDNGEASISIGYPENSMRQFKSKLYLFEDNVLTETVQVQNKAVKLRRFVFLETRLDRHRMNVTLKFPKKGSYVLVLFGFSESQPWQKLCSYLIVNEGVVVSSPYPVNTRDEWGPGFDTLRLGLRPITHKSGGIIIAGGVEQVVLNDPKGMQFRHDFLRHDGKVLGNSETTKISVLRDKGNDIVFVIDIDEKLLGTFVLQLYAKTGPKTPFQNFCNYFVRKVEAEKRVVVPRYQFTHVKVREEARVTQAPESGKITREVDASGCSQLVIDLKLHDRQEINFSEHARHWIVDDLGYVELNFPRKGKYSVKVLGRNVATNHFKTLLEEKIEVEVPSEKWSPYPKIESGWSSFYKVDRPISHHLPEKEYIPFSVAIKEAQDVAVLAPNGWYHLVPQNDGNWDGQIWTGPKSTKCRLLARFEIGSEKFTDLLWFKVMSVDDFESMEDRQESQRENALKIYQKQSGL